LAGLTSITTTFEPDEDCTSWDDCWMAGYYRRSDRTIHMNPDYLTGPAWDPEIAGGGVIAGSSIPDAGKHMISHELGHHIFWGTEWKNSRGYDILYEQYYGNFGSEWRYQYEAMGLRKYSLTNVREFMADCWKVYQYGSEKQKAALAGAMSMSHVRTLNDIFGRQIEGGQKGGEGSGHWGHAGRPGLVGGSAAGRMAGSGRVNREYFTKGPGRKIVEGLTDEEREGVINQLTHMRVQPRHLAGLKGIRANVPEDTEDWDFHSDWRMTERKTGETTEVEGLCDYGTGLIHVKPKYLTEDVSQRVVAGESLYYDKQSHVLSHELGHHVTRNSEWYKQNPRRLEDAMNHVIEKGMAKGIKRKRLWSAGLRPYSLTARSELRADIWKIYQYGGKTQRKTLAQLLGVKDLDDIFGE